MRDQSDRQLIRRLLERDEGALREAIDAYGPLVLGVARRIVVDRTLAEEVAQDCFVALWRRPGAFDPTRGTIRSWLAGMARNRAVDLVRREASLRRTHEALAAEVGESEGAGSDERIEGMGERHELRRALGELTPVQREAIVLAYFGGRTYREVAAELGVPEGTAKTRLRDGLERLRRVMGRGTGS